MSRNNEPQYSMPRDNSSLSDSIIDQLLNGYLPANLDKILAANLDKILAANLDKILAEFSIRRKMDDEKRDINEIIHHSNVDIGGECITNSTEIGYIWADCIFPRAGDSHNTVRRQSAEEGTACISHTPEGIDIIGIVSDATIVDVNVDSV